MLDNGRLDLFVGLHHSDIFIGLNPVHTDRFFIKHKLSEGKARFLSDQKPAHTN